MVHRADGCGQSFRLEIFETVIDCPNVLDQGHAVLGNMVQPARVSVLLPQKMSLVSYSGGEEGVPLPSTIVSAPLGRSAIFRVGATVLLLGLTKARSAHACRRRRHGMASDGRSEARA